MMKKILTICILLLESVCTITAQVKLQANNVDEVLKAMTLEEKTVLLLRLGRPLQVNTPSATESMWRTSVLLLLSISQSSRL